VPLTCVDPVTASVPSEDGVVQEVLPPVSWHSQPFE